MIFHADCNNFFASCECLSRPELRNIPMAVAGDPQTRHGIVVAKNELAKKFGVKTTDTVQTALRKCPDIIFVPPRHHFYRQISNLVNEIYLQYTPFVEPASIDESFLQLDTDDPVAFADMLRNRIRTDIGITISVGVSFCKVFAKMGSDYKKPDATTLITRDNYREIIWPLPVSDLLFAGKAAQQTLNRKYIFTIGELARTTKEYMRSILGRQGETLWEYANGIDPAPVRLYGDRDAARSISHGTTFPADISANEEIRAAVNALSDEVSRSLRLNEQKGSVVEIRVRRPDLSFVSRQTSLPHKTNLKHDIRTAAYQLLRENFPEGTPIRSITIGVSSLTADDSPEQISIFDTERERIEKVENTLDNIRKQFGKNAISLGLYPKSKNIKKEN